MITQNLLIKPIDGLFFRNSLPFGGEDSFLGKSVFPSPSVFYGSIRTDFLKEYDIDFEKFLESEKYLENEEMKSEFRKDWGTPYERGNLSCKGPYLFDYKRKELYFTIPASISYKEMNLIDNKIYELMLSLEEQIKYYQTFVSSNHLQPTPELEEMFLKNGWGEFKHVTSLNKFLKRSNTTLL